MTMDQLESGYFSNGEIFMGLKFLYHLTNTEDYELKFILTDQDNYSGAAGYDSFQILNNHTYAFSIGSFVEEPIFAGDSFSVYAGVPFSTPDKDKSRNNCANSTGTSGWLLQDDYLEACTRANLFAPQTKENNSFGGVTWGTFRGHKHPLSRLWLKVRPKEFPTKIASPFPNKAEIDAWYKTALTTEYGTKYAYYCNDGRKWSPQTLDQPLYTCQWNQTWSRNYDMTHHNCEWYKCTHPPQVKLLGPDFIVLTWKYDSTGLDIGQTLQVHCKNGKRIKGNLTRRGVDVECGPENSYIFPKNKMTCVSSTLINPRLAQN
ncbi:uncharacterized protein LOC131880916 [Tigriopus californicus]|uniref:uncharacterized protein LOC131880916 n=1 Tax=Tigriopus californicus TaxID=6832 RepID=UPI0027DA86D8|nr:uncharacterized protein LOC131880916 [Tigriopus californicus]